MGFCPVGVMSRPICWVCVCVCVCTEYQREMTVWLLLGQRLPVDEDWRERQWAGRISLWVSTLLQLVYSHSCVQSLMRPWYTVLLQWSPTFSVLRTSRPLPWTSSAILFFFYLLSKKLVFKNFHENDQIVFKSSKWLIISLLHGTKWLRGLCGPGVVDPWFIVFCRVYWYKDQ